MSVRAFREKKAIIEKNPRSGNRVAFSNGEKAVEIKAWEVWNSCYRRQTMPQSKLYSEETTLVVRSHDSFVGELQTDDCFIFNGYKYSVQSVHPVETPIGRKKDYEVELK